MARPIITLTTDYGTNDHLVGTLKGVILKINPDVTIVDITHDVSPYDLLDGALAIASSYSYFPPRTIHVVVVYPGVGTDRRPLLVVGRRGRRRRGRASGRRQSPRRGRRRRHQDDGDGRLHDDHDDPVRGGISA